MSGNPLELKRIHHVEFFTGNAKQAAMYYRKAFGFSQTGYSGLETGNRTSTHFLLEQNNTRFLISSGLTAGHEISCFAHKYGDAVKDIAFEVADARAAYSAALERGAQSAQEPIELRDEHGTVTRAAIKTYGEVVHSFISKHGYTGHFLPGFIEQRVDEPGCGILVIDHIVGNVGWGEMNQWADFYEKVLGFHRFITFDDKDISTEYSALMSTVMSDDKMVIKFPINEPAQGLKKSQIEEFIDWHPGPGVQHIALLTKDIVPTIRDLVSRGVEFLHVPDTYYDSMPERVGAIEEDLAELKPLGVLVDRDDKGYLLQLFSKPVQDRPTLFYEIIQRKGARGFGKGNFKALFESIELEQGKRGNL